MTKRICEIKDCCKPHRSRGWCSMHYQRWKRHSHPLSGRTPDGEPFSFLMSSLKTETDDCIIWPYNKRNGYGQLLINGKMKRANREVCRIAHGNPPTPKHEASHAPIICHNRSCINKRHLSWKTSSENNRDKVLDGTSNRGERHGHSKLTESDVIAIRLDNRIHRLIASDYNVSQTTVRHIKIRKRWAWL